MKITGAYDAATSAPLDATDDGAPAAAVDSIESVCDDLLRVVPDSCLSLTEKKTMPFPEVCPSLLPPTSAGPAAAVDVRRVSFETNDAATASLMTSSSAASSLSGRESEDAPPSGNSASGSEATEELEEEFGDFLVDAVNWL